METWTQEQIFLDGDLFFGKLIRQISKAKVSVDFEVYIFELDSFGIRVLQELIAASSRGVRVRLLLDGFGSIQWSASQIKNLRKEGILIRIYHPFPQILFRAISPWKILRLLRSPGVLGVIAKFNRRNHRKVCIVDSQVAFVGGMNVSGVHLKEFHGQKAWKDFGVSVSGSDIRQLSLAFQKAWETADLRKRIQSKSFRSLTNYSYNGLVKLNDTYKKRRHYHQEIIKRIRTAQFRVWIVSPYFVPDFRLGRAIRFAAEKGIDVKIILPSQIDIYIMKWVNRVFYQTLLRSHVRIYEYLPTTLHGKMMLIDSWLALGSSNRNFRSLFQDLEVDLVLVQPNSIQKMEKQFLKDIQDSREVFPTTWKIRRSLHRWLERFVLFFKKWL